MTNEHIADLLISSHQAQIASINLLQGYEIGQFDRSQLASILRLWAVKAASVTPQTIANTLADLIREYDPASPLLIKDPHIMHRCADLAAPDADRLVVRQAAYVSSWASDDDLDDFKSRLINFTAKPGDLRLYKKLEENLSTLVQVTIGDSKTITPPNAGSRAILYFTLKEPLLTEALAVPFDARADFLRDELGLVHLGPADPLVVLVLPSELCEARLDRGRPTAIDSSGNPRFVCGMTPPAPDDGWGRTANLARVKTDGARPGRPERVCGQFPPPGRQSGEQIHLAFVGEPRVPRHDSEGVLDDIFANSRIAEFCGDCLTLRQQILDILSPASGTA